MAALSGMALLSGAGAALGAYSSYKGAKEQAGAVKDASRSANALQQYMYEQNRSDLEPLRLGGYRAYAAMGDLSGINDGVREDLDKQIAELEQSIGQAEANPRQGGAIAQAVLRGAAAPTVAGLQSRLAQLQEQRTAMGDPYQFEADPGYQFRLQQGESALERAQAAGGRRLGGAAVKEALRYNSGLASQEYGNTFERLSRLAGMGGSAVNTTASLGANTAANIGSNTMAAGGALASAYGNMYGGVNNAIQGGLSNWVTMNALQQYNKGG